MKIENFLSDFENAPGKVIELIPNNLVLTTMHSALRGNIVATLKNCQIRFQYIFWFYLSIYLYYVHKSVRFRKKLNSGQSRLLHHESLVQFSRMG